MQPHPKPTFFEALTNEQKKEIEKISVRKKFRKGDRLFMPGDPTNQVYIILKGTIKCSFLSIDGKEIALPPMRPGELFGVSTLLNWPERVCMGTATSDLEVLCLDKNYIEKLMKNNIEVANLIIKYLGKRLRNSWKIIEDLASRNVKDRLLRLIYNLFNDYGQDQSGKLVVDINLTHEQIAELIGASRQTVSSIIKELEDEKVVKKQRKRILILNQEVFQDFD